MRIAYPVLIQEDKVKIDFFWDDDGVVWIATSKDVPGLVLESESFDNLVERVRYAVPELIELNGLPKEPEKRLFYYITTLLI